MTQLVRTRLALLALPLLLSVGVACGDKDETGTDSATDDSSTDDSSADDSGTDDSSTDDSGTSGENCQSLGDEDGNGQQDCEDAACIGTSACRIESSMEPCQAPQAEQAVYDTWFAEFAELSTVRVDTIATETAFDPGLAAAEPGNLDTSYLVGDDDFDCTFPPPDFQCPEGQVSAGSVELMVLSYGTCADDGTGAYALIIEGKGFISGPGNFDNAVY